ncbi:hypothetical protein ANCDUO_14162, partial [Ancylostoma duodenale]
SNRTDMKQGVAQKLMSNKYLKINGISLGGYKHSGQYKVELTFSNIMKGPSAIVDKLAKAAGAKPTGDGITYSIDCNAEFPSLEIIAGSTKYKIGHDLLITKIREGHCLFALSSMEQDSATGSAWYFGTPLMRQYCTIFDISENRKRIGFAEQIPEEWRSSVTPSPTTRRKFTRA